MVCDLNDTDTIQEFVTAFENEYQSCDLLFNNAAIINEVDRTGGVFDLSSQDLVETFQTNLFGPMELTKLLYPSNGLPLAPQGTIWITT